MNHTSSETPRWVVLTPEQLDHLDQGVIVRAHRGDTTVQGPLDNVSSDGTCVGIGSSPWSRFYIDGPVQVREQDVPQVEDTGEPDLLAALAASVARARARREDAALRGETR